MAVVVDPVECSHLHLIASPGLLMCEIDAVAPLRHAFDVNGETVVHGEAERVMLNMAGLDIVQLCDYCV